MNEDALSSNLHISLTIPLEGEDMFDNAEILQSFKQAFADLLAHLPEGTQHKMNLRQIRQSGHVRAPRKAKSAAA
jgi:hypothetical protein